MRSIIFIAAAAAAAVSGLAIYLASPSRDAVGGFQQQFLLLAEQAPERIIGVITAAMPNCLPAEARNHIADDKVTDLAARTFLKSTVLSAQEETTEESSAALIPWVTQQSEALTGQQKQTFLALAKGGLNSQETMFCLVSAVKTAAESKIDIKAFGWELRI